MSVPTINKIFFCAVFLSCISNFDLQAQIPNKKECSLVAYWKEIPKHKKQIWFGGGTMGSAYFDHFTDEVNYIPVPKKWTYTFRLRTTRSGFGSGYPTAFLREIAPMIGKTFKGRYFMTTFSTGVGYIWGRKWLDTIGRGVSFSTGQRTFSNLPLFTTEKFSTLGIPVRVHSSVIVFKRIALGIALGTSFNRKRMTLDGFLTLLVRVS